MPGTGEPVPDYLTVDYKEKKDVHVAYKTPFSVSAGITYKFPDGKQVFYASAEFFSRIRPFRMVEADESTIADPGTEPGNLPYSEWLSYASGAKPVINVAVGYSTELKKALLLKAGFRTDFNYQKNFDYSSFADYNKIQNVNLDLYYVTCGLSWNILGQDIITGIQYAFGSTGNLKQIANLSDPVEYNTVENLPLQGTRLNEMNGLYNSISLYFGASFNFSTDKK
jgi:hypothetical protein